jgi:hypothetical protein
MKLLYGLASIGLAALVAASASACGGGGGSGGGPDASTGGNPGFATPDVTTTAYMKSGATWTEVGPANWSCLGTPSGDQAATVTITVTGEVHDFQYKDQTVSGATITAYQDTNFAGAGVATATSAGDGTFSIDLPAGTSRVAFKTSAAEFLDTYLLNQYFEPDVAAQMKDLEPISQSLANALPAFINQTRTPGLGVLAGAIRDCDQHEVMGAIATVSSTRGSPEHLDGAATYYFQPAGDQDLPVRLSQQAYTDNDGLFMVIELPPTSTAYLQVLGYLPDQDPSTDQMTLIAEIPAPVLADSVITASMEALRQ